MNQETEERNPAIDRLEKRLGHEFADRNILVAALRHRSYVHQVKAAGQSQSVEDNQRLEFLGDAVLSLTISTMLYHRFPQYQEGLLSRMRAGLVNEARLADLARDLGLPDALLLGRGEETTGGRDKNSILADAVEAVIAAVYLDGGFDAALIVVRRLWGDLIGSSSHDELLKDFKTRLQEQTQRGRGHTPVYELTGSFGPDHARVFEVALKIDGRTVSAGTGRSKKEAEQNAARTALEQTASGWHDPGGDA